MAGRVRAAEAAETAHETALTRSMAIDRNGLRPVRGRKNREPLRKVTHMNEPVLTPRDRSRSKAARAASIDRRAARRAKAAVRRG